MSPLVFWSLIVVGVVIVGLAIWLPMYYYYSNSMQSLRMNGKQKTNGRSNVLFEDHFPGTTLNPQNWRIAAGDTSDAIESIRIPGNVLVANGQVQLYTTQNASDYSTSKKWNTGLISTTKVYGYGLYEARYTYCAATGLNNSFFLMTEADDEQNEIDVNEGKWLSSARGTVSMKVHRHAKDLPDISFCGKNVILAGDLGTEFHTYAVRYTPNGVQWLIDSSVVHECSDMRFTKENQFRIFFSTAVVSFAGPVNANEIEGTKMTLLWVRVSAL